MQQVLDCTPEQLATLTRQKTRVIRETKTDSVDVTTGEILHALDQKVLLTSSEPDYIKIYYRTMLAFTGVTDIPVDFLLAMSGYISWVSDSQPMIFRNDKITREQISKLCHIKADMYHKYITRCVKNGLLVAKTGYRGVYEVNPFFIAKGRWDDIKALRATFDFMDGKWTKRMEVTDDESSED